MATSTLSIETPKAGTLRSRLAHFGPSGQIGLAIVAFWVLAAIVGPALLSRTGAMGGGEVFAPISARHWLGTLSRPRQRR
jgi:peptide/nickel transport system permease protein